MGNKRKSKVFIGYQIKSRYHRKVDLKKAIEEVKNKVEHKEKVNLEIQYGEFPAGRFLFREISNAIKNCEIAIFDISENNPNVLIEVGMAYGSNKCVILLKNNLSRRRYYVPSDVRAFIYIPYRNNSSICSDSTCSKIISAIREYYREISDALYPKLLWGFNETDTVYIVCPELKTPKKRQEPEPEEFLYLGKYGDIDSLLAICCSLYRLYPELNINICTCKEFHRLSDSPYSDNLIVIGGPDYNKVTRAFMKYTPFKFGEKANKIILENKKNGKYFQPKFIKHSGTVRDYGFFFKIPNPHNNKKKLIMINGIHTYGVYGAAKCFSFYDEREKNISCCNSKDVINAFGDDPNFAVVLEVKGINKRVITPKINKTQLIPL